MLSIIPQMEFLLSSEDHGWENGDFIKFDNDSLVFTCARDSNQTEHAYPRSTDPVSGKWIQFMMFIMIHLR